jgi:hypothetical protein
MYSNFDIFKQMWKHISAWRWLYDWNMYQIKYNSKNYENRLRKRKSLSLITLVLNWMLWKHYPDLVTSQLPNANVPDIPILNLIEPGQERSARCFLTQCWRYNILDRINYNRQLIIKYSNTTTATFQQNTTSLFLIAIHCPVFNQNTTFQRMELSLSWVQLTALLFWPIWEWPTWRYRQNTVSKTFYFK